VSQGFTNMPGSRNQYLRRGPDRLIQDE
jgi:hypothetical protein